MAEAARGPAVLISEIDSEIDMQLLGEVHAIKGKQLQSIQPFQLHSCGIFPLFVRLTCRLRQQGFPCSGRFSDALLQGLAVLKDLSDIPDNRVYMGGNGLGLLNALFLLIQHCKNTPVKSIGLQIILNLVAAKENQQLLQSSSHSDVLPLLMDITSKADNYDDKVAALWIIQRLAIAPENKVHMACPETGLIPLLLDITKNDKAVAREKALGALKNLAIAPENKVTMTSLDFGLLSLLREILNDCDDATRLKALNLLLNLSNCIENKAIIGSAEMGLLPLLVSAAQDSTSEEIKLKSVCTLDNLSRGVALNKELMVAPHLRLLPVLVEVLTKDSGETRLRAANCIINLSTAAENKALIASPELKLIPTLCDIMQNNMNDESLTLRLLAIINSLSCCTVGVRAILSDLYQLSPILHMMLNSESEAIRLKAVDVLWNMGEIGAGDADVGNALLTHAFLVHLLHILSQSDPDRSTWMTNSDCTAGTGAVAGAGTVNSKIMNFLMNLATYDDAVESMKQAGVLDVVSPIATIESNGCEALKAMFVVAFLVGREESSRADVQQYFRQTTIDQLLTVFESILDLKDGDDYPFGTFCVRVAVQACLVISISDSNKAMLVNSSVLNLLRCTLEQFCANGPVLRGANGCSAGGGGNDVRTAEFAIEALLQLSCYFDNDDELQSQYMTQESGIYALMTELQCNSKLGFAAMRNVNQLLLRLQPLPARQLRRQVSSEILSKHVMISYSWHRDAQPELVKRLADELKSAGVDVWRDEVGSSIVGPISGATDECMAEAIEAANVVIICVSKQYKESANCRMEAKYANQRLKKGKLKIVYVMMQEEYTTVSCEDTCDGWLGLMIGDSLWYRLWDEKHLVKTKDDILAFLGAECTGMNNNNKINSMQRQSSTIVTLLSSTPIARSSSPPSKASDLCVSSEDGAVDAPNRRQEISSVNDDAQKINIQSGAAVEAQSGRSSSSSSLDAVKVSAAATAPSSPTTSVAAALSSNLQEGDIDGSDMNASLLAWQILQNPAKAINPQELQALLNRLGVTEAEDLQYCDESAIDKIEELLKMAPKAKFQELRGEWKAQHSAKKARLDAFVQEERGANCTVQ